MVYKYGLCAHPKRNMRCGMVGILGTTSSTPPNKRADYATIYKMLESNQTYTTPTASNRLFVDGGVAANDRVMPLLVLGVACEQLLWLVCKATI